MIADSHAVKYREILYTLHLISPNGNIIHNYCTKTQPGKWYEKSTHPIWILPVLYAGMCVGGGEMMPVYLLLCSFITCIDSCYHHHIQDTEQFYHKISSCSCL